MELLSIGSKVWQVTFCGLPTRYYNQYLMRHALYAAVRSCKI